MAKRQRQKLKIQEKSIELKKLRTEIQNSSSSSSSPNQSSPKNVDSDNEEIFERSCFHKHLSPSNLYNFFRNACLEDYLNLYGDKSLKEKSNQNSFVMREGQIFEEQIFKEIEKLCPIVYISTTPSQETIKQTKIEILKGTPIIASAPLKTKTLGFDGVADLIVRSDYLQLLFEKPNVYQNFDIPAPSLNKPYHYVVIDIKFRTLYLLCNGINLNNSIEFDFFKAQLYIYNRAVGEIQGYTPEYGFVIGRRCVWASKGNSFYIINPLQRPAIINFQEHSDYIEKKLQEGRKWYFELKTNGKNWTLYPPTRKELYPNTKIKSSWSRFINQYAKSINDITLIFNCGIKNRENALLQNITSWNDIKCNSENLKMGSYKNIVDKILEINRQDEILISPKKIETNLFNWREENINECYLDFEYIMDAYCSENVLKQESLNILFMIGCYFWNKENRNWDYKSWIIENLSRDDEYKIMCDFNNFLEKEQIEKIWYWHAETSLWNKTENFHYTQAHNDNNYDKMENISSWIFERTKKCDLYKIFTEEPIVIKGALNYNLKNVASALNEHGYIICNLDNCDVFDGITASYNAYNIYKKRNSTSNSIKEDEEMIKIEEYNKFDVKVLSCILEYIREEL